MEAGHTVSSFRRHSRLLIDPARRSGRALAVAPVIVSVTFDAMRGSLHLSRTASPFQSGPSPEKYWPVLIRSMA